MDNTDRHISGLWTEAKSEAPERSFEETQTAFASSMASGASGSGSNTGSGFNSIINLNSIIMSSIVIVAISVAWSFLAEF